MMRTIRIASLTGVLLATAMTSGAFAQEAAQTFCGSFRTAK